MNMYEHNFAYNYILVSPGLLHALTSLFFFGSYFLKFKNALRNKKTAKLVFIFKYMHSYLRE